MSDLHPVRGARARCVGALVAGLVTVVSALVGVVAPSSAAPTQSGDDPYPESAWEKYDGATDRWSEGGGDVTDEEKAQGWQGLWVRGCMARVGIRRVTQAWAAEHGENAYRIRVQVKCNAQVEDAQERELAGAPAVEIRCHGAYGQQRSDWVMERTTRLERNLDAKFRKTFVNNRDQAVHGVCTFRWPGRGEDTTINSPTLGDGSRRIENPGEGPWGDVEWDRPTKWSTDGADASEEADKNLGWHTIDNGCIARVGMLRVTSEWLREQRQNWYRLRAQVKCQDYVGPSGGEVRVRCEVLGTAPSGQNWDVSTRQVSGTDLEGLRRNDGERAAKKYRRTFLNPQDTAVQARCTFTWVNADGQAHNTTEATTITSPRLGGEADRRTGSGSSSGS